MDARLRWAGVHNNDEDDDDNNNDNVVVSEWLLRVWTTGARFTKNLKIYLKIILSLKILCKSGPSCPDL